MKNKLRHLINALRITDQLPLCGQKDEGVSCFFSEIQKLGIDIDHRTSGDILYYEFGIADKAEDFEVSVKVIRSKYSMMIIIDADFGDEE